jgi:hypothetical protein
MNSLSACAQEGLGKIARRRWREGRENCEAKQVTENFKKKSHRIGSVRVFHAPGLKTNWASRLTNRSNS